MIRGRLLPLLIGTVLLAPGLAFGQQVDDPWGGLRADGERPPAATPPRPTPAPAAAATRTPASPSVPAAAQAPAAPARPAPAAAAPPRPAAAPPAQAAATPPRAPAPAAPAAAATAIPPLPLPRPTEAPPRAPIVVAVPEAEPAPQAVVTDGTAMAAEVDPAPAAQGGSETQSTSETQAAPEAQVAQAPAAPAAPIDPIAAAAAAASTNKAGWRMPSLPGDIPLAAAAYGIMSAIAPISEAAAAVPPVAPPDAAPSGALPRTEARVVDVDPRAGTPAIPVAPAPVVLPSMMAEPAAPPAAAPAPVAAPAVAAAPVTPPRSAPLPATATAIPVAAPAIVPAPTQMPPRQGTPVPAAPVQMALANPASVIPPAAPATAPLGKVEASPGSVRAPLWPQDLVRALRRAQDSMAQGSAPALEAQRTLIARIEQEFGSADASTWQDPHNARAAVTYFLSGGNPSILRRMMDMQPPPAIDPRLLRGTLAYLEGREEESLRQLKDIDARSLPPSLGGQVALAQAALHVRKDPAKSAQLLAVARLLAPGTLVEEAALRRAILIASQLGDAAQFEYLSKQYLFRFRNSVYAGNFRQRFAAALSRIGFGNDPAQFHRLDAMLDMLEPDSRREMELTVARAAVVQGLTTTANFAADRALAALPDGSDEAERARLYRGASLAANPNTYKDALTDLGSVDKDRLAPADAALLAAASATAENVRRATDTQPVLAPKAAQAVGPLTKDEMLPVMDRARAAINNADAMLKGTAR